MCPLCVAALASSVAPTIAGITGGAGSAAALTTLVVRRLRAARKENRHA